MSDALVGKTLPSVSLKVTGGETVTLPDDIKGQWTLLYFYPKDDTPGCTIQACSYRDNMKQFEQSNIKIYGVSADDLTSHDQFISKFNLNFPLLADTERELSTALATLTEYQIDGKSIEGISRDSFLISPEGEIKHVWRKVDPNQTVAETFAKARELMG